MACFDCWGECQFFHQKRCNRQRCRIICHYYITHIQMHRSIHALYLSSVSTWPHSLSTALCRVRDHIWKLVVVSVTLRLLDYFFQATNNKIVANLSNKSLIRFAEPGMIYLFEYGQWIMDAGMQNVTKWLWYLTAQRLWWQTYIFGATAARQK